jgi:hypothetical protein
MKTIDLPLTVAVLLFLVNGTPAQQAYPTAPHVADVSAKAGKSGTAKRSTTSAENPTAAEVEDLKRRLEELEEQNRILSRALLDVKAKIESMTVQPGSAVVAGTTHTDQSTAAAKARPTSAAEDDKNSYVRWSEVLAEGNKLKLYGFLRLDLIGDSQRPNNPQTIFFINSPDPRAGNSDSGDLTLHPRLTRLGLDFTGPRIGALGNARLTGKLETDFANGGTESRQIIRIRHAYLNVAWQEFSLLAGQTWDTVSPLLPTVSNETVLWNAGNVGDRRPQLRAAYEPQAGEGKLSFIGGIGLTGAIDALDLDANGIRDGEESSRPSIQARIGYSHPIWSKDRMASIGISGYYGFMKTGRPVNETTEFRNQLINIDYTLPITAWLSLKGEGWWGRNMSDIRGGAGQGLNTATGRPIRGRGGWSEAGLRVSRIFSFHPGFSTDDPVDEDLPARGRTRNRTFYVANRITPGGGFLLGIDYLRWKTSYLGLQPGVDNRFNLFLQYSF